MVSFTLKAVTALALLPAISARLSYPDSLAELANGRELGECHDCSCFTCDAVVQQPDGSLDVKIGHCKDGSISWMCCAGVDGVTGNCNLAECHGDEDPSDPKCETIAKGDGLVVNIPGTARTFLINTHDGKTGNPHGDLNVGDVCGGPAKGQGGSCVDKQAGKTAHCLLEFDVATDCKYTGATCDKEVKKCPDGSYVGKNPPDCSFSECPVPEPEPAPATPDDGPVPSPDDGPVPSPDDGPVPSPDAPEPVPSPQGGSYGDPHVRTWGGDQFDFHGACDLVLVDSPSFDHGKGFKVHIRTKSVTWWSYIASAVVKIGDDTFEVQGGTNVAHYWINGVQGNITENGDLDSKIGGYPIKFKKASNRQKNFRFMNLPGGHAIGLETFNDFVRVNIRADTKKQFTGALGLMGAFPTGAKVSRDGTTAMDNTDAFGQEWQVRASEEKLFHNLEGPQHPESCIMPTATEKKSRRLGEVMLTEEEAAQACARVSEEYRDACIFDVLATNSMDMAGSY